MQVYISVNTLDMLTLAYSSLIFISALSLTSQNLIQTLHSSS